MISNTSQMVTILKTVTGFNNRVFLEYPKARPHTPYCCIGILGRNQAIVSANEEIVTEITYSVDVYADKLSSAESLMASVVDLLLTYGMRNVGYTTGLVESPDIMHVSASFRLTMDKRGNTYTSI